MLKEGWDCKTVTHIMGLRAFASQLLCEQIVGRGLRRRSYTLNKKGMFDPEYVNIFGIPFSYIPHEGSDSDTPKPTSPKVPILPDPSKEKYQITWPNVERIDFNLTPKLKVDFSKVEPLKISDIAKIAELAPKINGEPDYSKIKKIDLYNLVKEKRMNTLCANLTLDICNQIHNRCKINKDEAYRQIFLIVENFLNSEQFQTVPRSFLNDENGKKAVIMIARNTIAGKISSVITHQNSNEIVPIYKKPKYKTTKEAVQWPTGKKTGIFKKTHMNRCVVDSPWELTHARELDRNPNVEAWVKNDHLGFTIPYVHNGVVLPYTPDFIIRLSNKEHIILEVKGRKKHKDDSKWNDARIWVDAVNSDKENGKWHFEVSSDPTGNEIHEIVKKY